MMVERSGNPDKHKIVVIVGAADMCRRPTTCGCEIQPMKIQLIVVEDILDPI